MPPAAGVTAAAEEAGAAAAIGVTGPGALGPPRRQRQCLAQSLPWGTQIRSPKTAAGSAASAAGAWQSPPCRWEKPPRPSAGARSGRQDYCVRLSYCGKHSLLGSGSAAW